MKKLLFLLFLFISTAATPPKEYTFKLTDAQVQDLWQALQQSNAPHQKVVELQTLIQQQYAAQADTTNKK